MYIFLYTDVAGRCNTQANRNELRYFNRIMEFSEYLRLDDYWQRLQAFSSTCIRKKRTCFFITQSTYSIADLYSYVRRLLGVENVIFNLKSVVLKLELPAEETLNQVVACWQSETKQVELVLQRWREKQGHTEDLAVLRKALTGLEPEGNLSFH